MINLLIGQPGSGKTKDMIEAANKSQATAKGSIVFVCESNESILELKHDIRYIDISEYPIESSNALIPFLYGLLGSNNDIEKIYLDGILNIYIMTAEEICSWLDRVKILSDNHKVDFEISVSISGDTPECLKNYI
ncbi:MAG: hypothetical protein N4A76_00830 [Firmicutes bacterium]|jgi:hypothetical protein|nr:hypothetical protein [Bacillota bacterium]